MFFRVAIAAASEEDWGIQFVFADLRRKGAANGILERTDKRQKVYEKDEISKGSLEANQGARVHLDRIVGGYRHYRYFGGHAVAGSGQSQGQGEKDQLRLQPQTMGLNLALLRRRKRRQV